MNPEPDPTAAALAEVSAPLRDPPLRASYKPFAWADLEDLSTPRRDPPLREHGRPRET